MILRQTWLKVSDSSQAKWLKVFTLYGGFFRKHSKSGDVVRGSIRVVQPLFCFYKGFSKKQLIKGRVSKTLISTQRYIKNASNVRFSIFSSQNQSILIKKKFVIISKHSLGPGFLANKNKKLITTFRSIF